MFRLKVLLPLLVVLAAVTVGCTQRPTASTGGHDRALEAKVAKLEKDLNALQNQAVTARDEAARQLADAARQVADSAQRVADLGQQRDTLSQERDMLKLQLKARTGERDVVQGQLDTFRKDLKELLGKVDAAANAITPPAVSSLAR